jgi:hypothetical protein
MMYRQGDVLLVRVDESPAKARVVPRTAGRVILALGESTGHAHAIADPGVELLENAHGRVVIVPEGGATLSHEEHAPIPLPAGAYRVILQREYRPEGDRNVAD